MYERCRKVTQLMDTLNNYQREHVSLLFSKRQYDFKEIKVLHRLFANFGENTSNIIKDSVNLWKKNVESQRINPWFKRAAYILALNSTVDIQKSFWRMRENMNNRGVALSAAKIVKIKKMFNNIRKAYELVVAKSFWIIERHGKTAAEGPSATQETKQQPQVRQQPQRQIVEETRQVVQAPQVTQAQNNQQQAISQEYERKMKATLSKIQQASLRSIVAKQTRKLREAGSRSLKRWAFNAIPERRIELGYKQLADGEAYNARFISQIGAIEVLDGIFTQLKNRHITSSFKDLMWNKFTRQIE